MMESLLLPRSTSIGDGRKKAREIDVGRVAENSIMIPGRMPASYDGINPDIAPSIISELDHMSRKRTSQITESIAALRALEKKHKGSPQAERVTFLRLLREQPSRTLAETARLLGRSEPTLERWLRAYRTGGTASLLEISKGGNPRPPRLHDEGIRALAHKVHVEGIRNVGELRAWVKKEYGVEYSRQGMQYLLKEKVGEVVGTDEPTPGVRLNDAKGDAGHSSTPRAGNRGEYEHFSREAIEFLNSIPTTHDVREWVAEFREHLRIFLGDVDRISIVINVDCDLRDPRKYYRGPTITQNANSGVVSLNLKDAGPKQRFLAGAQRAGVPLHLYHSPEVFEYYVDGAAYAGLIALWREKRCSRISQKTLRLMKGMEKFFVAVISGVIARNKYSDRIVSNVFNVSLKNMMEGVALTEREQAVIILQLFGHTYEQIADRLSLSINTVRKHIASIHRKTGTHSFTELFAKYFTPALGF